MTKISAPQPGEYAPYAKAYIDRVPEDGLIFQYLRDNLATTKNMLASLSDEQLSTSHDPGEWTIKEILIHVMDAERVFAYRALRIARNDKTEMPGFDENEYVPESRANERSFESIMAEYEAVRNATVTLFENLAEDTWERIGRGSSNPLSVRAAVYQIAGHELHHIESIKENYLS